jgi:hypothetical protein
MLVPKDITTMTVKWFNHDMSREPPVKTLVCYEHGVQFIWFEIVTMGGRSPWIRFMT